MPSKEPTRIAVKPHRKREAVPAAPSHDLDGYSEASDPDGADARIYRAIFDGVLNHRLKAGTKVPENELCQLFDVGRSVARRVLEKLANDGIVSLRPSRGAVIVKPTPEDTRQIFEARRLFERVLVELAAQRATVADIQELKFQLAEEDAAMNRFDRPSWARLASGFHLRIATLARNPVLQKYLTELVTRSSLIVSLYEQSGHASCEHDEHAAIVARIEARDAAGAVKLMEAHLHAVEKRIEVARIPKESSLAEKLGLRVQANNLNTSSQL